MLFWCEHFACAAIKPTLEVGQAQASMKSSSEDAGWENDIFLVPPQQTHTRSLCTSLLMQPFWPFRGLFILVSYSRGTRYTDAGTNWYYDNLSLSNLVTSWPTGTAFWLRLRGKNKFLARFTVCYLDSMYIKKKKKGFCILKISLVKLKFSTTS